MLTIIENGTKDDEQSDEQSNKDWQGVDKSPGEEKGKGEKVTKWDLKGKKVDGDPSEKKDQPAVKDDQ